MRKSSGLFMRILLFVYECVRLLFLLGVLILFLDGPGGPAGMFQGASMEMEFPFTAYIAANILFPLMAFFLLIRFAESLPYIPLFITGKAIFILVFAVWTAFLGARSGGIPYRWTWAFFLFITDLASIANAAMLKPKSQGVE
jgi:hypothetical protein